MFDKDFLCLWCLWQMKVPSHCDAPLPSSPLWTCSHQCPNSCLYMPHFYSLLSLRKLPYPWHSLTAVIGVWRAVHMAWTDSHLSRCVLWPQKSGIPWQEQQWKLQACCWAFRFLVPCQGTSKPPGPKGLQGLCCGNELCSLGSQLVLKSADRDILTWLQSCQHQSRRFLFVNPFYYRLNSTDNKTPPASQQNRWEHDNKALISGDPMASYHRMVEVGMDLWRPSSPHPPCCSRLT